MTAVVPAFAGEVIDGVVASVNRQPILRSDWERSHRFRGLHAAEADRPGDSADRVLALQHLIDRQLLKAQMGDASYMQPSEEQLQAGRRQAAGAGSERQRRRCVAAAAGQLRAERGDSEGASADGSAGDEFRRSPPASQCAHSSRTTSSRTTRTGCCLTCSRTAARRFRWTKWIPRIRELLTEQHIDELLDAWLHNLRQQADIRSSVSIPGVNAPADGRAASGLN